MTKRELIKAMEGMDEDEVVICMDESGGWDNIQEVRDTGAIIEIVFGGGSPFSDE